MNILPVPDFVTTQLLVYLPPTATVTPELLRQKLVEWICENLPPNRAQALTHMVTTPLFGLEIGPRSSFPELSPEALASCAAESKTQLEAATRLCVLNIAGPFRRPFDHWFLGRAVARMLAEHHGGLAFDLSSMVWPGMNELELHEHIPVGRAVRLQCVARDDSTLRVRTLGLDQFGLPELEAHDAPKDIINDVNLLAQAVAQHLLMRYPPGYEVLEAPEALNVPQEITLAVEDMLGAFALPESHREAFNKAVIGLTLMHAPAAEPAPDGDAGDGSAVMTAPVLLMHKPAQAEITTTQWFYQVTQQVFHSNPLPLAGADAEDEDPIALAHALAVATLPRVRERFVAGMPKGSELHVKYPVDNEEGDREYVWMSVQSWQEQILQGELLHDLAFSESPSAGDAVDLLQRRVYDWSIYHADGSQEGGSTDAAPGLPKESDESAAP